MNRDIRIKRVYEKPEDKDGLRILVDRVWPRGLTRKQIHADLWLQELAPSAPLRKWFAHDHSKWEEFKAHYFEELNIQTETIQKLLDQAEDKPITLLFSARDTQYNQAAALRDNLINRLD
jgi:uncharacterized protein YeaO (DUF488 family)